jgi:hypothetical protein
MNPPLQTLSRVMYGFALFAALAAPATAALRLRDAQGYATLDAARAVYAYDSVLDVSWYLQPSSQLLTWQQAQQWASGLKLLGLSGWQLPGGDLGCTPGAYRCHGDPLSELFFNELGNSAPGDAHPVPLNAGPFHSLSGLNVWTSGAYTPTSSTGLYFSMEHGFQSIHSKFVGLQAIAEHDGDVLRVSAVPEADRGVLVAVGLAGLLLRRRRA